MKGILKLLGIIVFMMIIGIFIIACDNSTKPDLDPVPGKLTITNFDALTSGMWLYGDVENAGLGNDILIFSVDKPIISGITAKGTGAIIGGTTIKLNVYRITRNDNLDATNVAPFTENIIIPTDELRLGMYNSSSLGTATHFYNNKDIQFINGNASINFGTDMH